MSSGRRQQIEELYRAARERGRGVLSDVDPAMRWEVEQLLDQASTATRLSAGAQLGPYRIESPLGAGGMGTVFRATDTRLGRS